jgi:hypothetical protein
MNWLDRLKEAKGKLKELGYEKERAALALLSLSFFAIIYFLVAFQTPPEWARVFCALSVLYLVGFLAVASQWFWARWFASGLGWSGFMVGMMALVMVGWHPSLAIYTLLHGTVVAMLMGPKMAARYELQTAWRERYKMDEFGVARLGKAVTRGSASLPTLVMWALAPREGDQMLWLPLVALGLGVLGLTAVVRMRAWGLLALGVGAGATSAAFLLMPSVNAASLGAVSFGGIWMAMASSPNLAVAFMTAALVPFAGAIISFLRTDPRR